MKHYTRRYTVLLVGVLLALFLALAGGAAAQSAPNASELEPNDTQALADVIALGQTTAAIDPVGDVDYFKLSLYAGQTVYLAALTDCDSTLNSTLAVFDAGGALVAQPDVLLDDTIFAFVPAATSDYFVRVVSDGSPTFPDQYSGDYTLWALMLPYGEPNDTPETAAPIAWGDAFTGTIYAPHDPDYYRLHARPGDVMSVTVTTDRLNDMGGIQFSLSNIDQTYAMSDWVEYAPGTARITYVVPFESDYIIHPMEGYGQCETPFPISYDLTVERLALHVGAATAGMIDGVAFGVNDIMARNAAGQWYKVFDGEDVGITTALMGFEWTSDGELLLALKNNQTVGALGLVKGQDILKFIPTQLGDNTRGTFSFYLRGAQAGLTTIGEKIDAIALLANDGLLISTTGSGAVPKAGGGILYPRDEDLLFYHPNGSMPAAGTWVLEIDGTKHMPRFTPLDLRLATIANDYSDSEVEVFYHDIYLMFGVDKPYQYTIGRDENVVTYKAAAGDLMRFPYIREIFSRWDNIQWEPLTRQMIGFPKQITNVSIGK